MAQAPHTKPMAVREYGVKSPSGDVHNMPWPNARDLVRNCGYTFTKDEAVVIKQAQAAAEKNAFIQGNDPRKLDVEAEAAKLAAEKRDVPLAEMTRDELVAHAKASGIEVDGRWGSGKLLETILDAQTARADAVADAAEGAA